MQQPPHSDLGPTSNAVTVREITDRALAGVSQTDRERIWVALENSRACPAVDAAALSQSLAHLIERAVHARSPEILVRGDHKGGRTFFAVISYTEAPAVTGEEGSGHSRFSEALQGVTHIGGRLSVEHTPAGHTHATIEVRSSRNVA